MPADLLCLSGGVPPQTAFVREARARGIPLSNDSLLTLQMGKALALGPTVGITGSSGKTTTTTLVGKMLAASGVRAHVGGNIGAPLLDRLHTVRPRDPLVLELSSFQLELFDPAFAWGHFANLGPDVAAILNITPNHLDRHASMAEYATAKLNLLRYMPPGGTVVVNLDDPVTAALAPDLPRPDRVLPPAAWDLNRCSPTCVLTFPQPHLGWSVTAAPYPYARRLARRRNAHARSAPHLSSQRDSTARRSQHQQRAGRSCHQPCRGRRRGWHSPGRARPSPGSPTAWRLWPSAMA